MLFAVLACALWLAGKSLAKRGAESHEALGRVVWLGDASYDASVPGVGMRAGTKRHIAQAGVRVLLDGTPEPLEFISRGGSSLRQLTSGDRVRVAYREGGWLMWHEVSLTRIEKLD
jgi:hypothetical protein